MILTRIHFYDYPSPLAPHPHLLHSRAGRPALMTVFEEPPIASQCIPPDRETTVQPLGTNGEQEVEIHKMDKALRDFDQQMMITNSSGIVEMV
jgi:hypothetical protein